jgi:hypothetical protein
MIIEQLTREDLKGMSAEEIRDANERGALNQIQGRPLPIDMDQEASFTRADLRRMSPEQIVEAGKAGKIMTPSDEAHTRRQAAYVAAVQAAVKEQ